VSRGIFVAIEGPNGVGKSTIVAATGQQLEHEHGVRVHVTKEPSTTSLGQAIRSLEPTLPSEALALACAADRLDHLAREIEPAVAAGTIVLSDRYVPSSLVLQRLDGFELEEIWALNKNARAPDLTVYLDDEATTIDQRLAARNQSARFEAAGAADREIELYSQARAFLETHGWTQRIIDCRGRTPDEIGKELAALIAETGADRER
jgi:dTMP kinase